MRLTPPPDPSAEPEEPGQYWKDFIRDTAPQFRRPTIEQLQTLIRPIWEGLIAGSTFVEERLAKVLAEVHPDVVVQDNVVGFPAVLTSGAPWVRMVSCNPLEMKDPAVPPAFSGYPTQDRRGWDAFRHEYARVHHDLWDEFDGFMRDRGAPPLEPLEFVHRSPHLNLYLYPEEADYERSQALGPTWRRLDSSVRDTDPPYALPEGFGREEGSGGLIYVSLGSLGSADVELMQRLIDVLATTRHRFIVSTGPQHELIRLPDTMAGAEFLPQTSILPMVDLVITHGGNNTVTECLHFGRPMVVLPLFWDQYDNAQRVDELGLGRRLPSYTFDPEELSASIEELLADGDLRARLSRVSARLQASPGTVRAADEIERVAAGR